MKKVITSQSNSINLEKTNHFLKFGLYNTSKMFLEEDTSTVKKQSKLHLFMENQFFSNLWNKMTFKTFSKNLPN